MVSKVKLLAKLKEIEDSNLAVLLVRDLSGKFDASVWFLIQKTGDLITRDTKSQINKEDFDKAKKNIETGIRNIQTVRKRWEGDIKRYIGGEHGEEITINLGILEKQLLDLLALFEL